MNYFEVLVVAARAPIYLEVPDPRSTFSRCTCITVLYSEIPSLRDSDTQYPASHVHVPSRARSVTTLEVTTPLGNVKHTAKPSLLLSWAVREIARDRNAPLSDAPPRDAHDVGLVC